ncbi:unnamed protein product, partial [marine sediment metagenome]
DNSYVGVTVNYNNECYRLDELRDSVDAKHKVASFEPMYNAIINPDLTGIEWCWFGAQTQPELQPNFKDMMYLVNHAANSGAYVFMKNNLWTPRDFIRLEQFPEAMI